MSDETKLKQQRPTRTTHPLLEEVVRNAPLKDAIASGEWMLLIFVFDRAFHDLSNPRKNENSRAWFENVDDKHVFSCAAICSLLGISQRDLIERLKKLPEWSTVRAVEQPVNLSTPKTTKPDRWRERVARSNPRGPVRMVAFDPVSNRIISSDETKQHKPKL